MWGVCMDILFWMNNAISKTGQIEFNSEFCLKDLFDGVIWNSLAKGERLSFGRFFKNEVISGHVPNIIYIGKSQNNSAKYKKVH